MSRRGGPRGRGLAALLLLALAAGGCASTLGGSSAKDEELERLRRRVVELEREARVGQVETARLRRELTRLEAELEAVDRADAAPAPAPERPVPASPGVADADGEPVLDTGPGIESSDLADEAIAAVEPSGPIEVPPAVPAPAAPAPAPVEAEAVQDLYDRGYTLFHQKSYLEAEESFRRFLELYPTSDLADNAAFWIGECRYARGELGPALEAFTATVESYPEGNKVADAMVKAGKCLEALGDAAAARDTYQEVRRRFPGTAASAIASERLEDLGG